MCASTDPVILSKTRIRQKRHRLLPGEPTRKNNQSDSFLPTTELAHKTVVYSKIGQANKNKNIKEYGNKSEKSCTYFLKIFYQIEADFWCEMLEKLMLTSGA